MKSVKMFGKKIPILAILVIVLISGIGVYGAVVSYLSSTIVSETTVTSPIALTGELTYWEASKGFLYADADTKVGWSSEQAHGGAHSVKISVADGTEWGYVALNYEGNLASISTVSFWSYVIGFGGELHPYVVLDLDTDDDDIVDTWVVQLELPSYGTGGEGSWQQTSFADASKIHVPGLYTDQNPATAKTLTNLKAEPLGLGTYADATVLRVKINYGQFTGQPAMYAYIDDVSGDVSSDFETESAPFGETATISISIMAGSEFFMTFDIANQANIKMDGKLEITVDGILDFVGDGSEFAVEPDGYTRTGSNDYVYTLTSAFSFDPLTSVEFPVHMQLSSIAAPDTFTLSARVVP